MKTNRAQELIKKLEKQIILFKVVLCWYGRLGQYIYGAVVAAIENAICVIKDSKNSNEMRNAVKVLRDEADFLENAPPYCPYGYKYMQTVRIMRKAAEFIEKRAEEMVKEISAIVNDLPNRFNYDQKPYLTLNDFGLYTFEQAWGSTVLGFDCIGGQAMTSARTYVFVPKSRDGTCIVYFGGRFAYAVPYSNVFMADVAAGCVAPVAMSEKYCKQ